jgi:cytochrome P450
MMPAPSSPSSSRAARDRPASARDTQQECPAARGTITLPAAAGDPHDHWARMRAGHPVGYCERAGAWLVLAHRAARDVLEAPDTFTTSAYRDLPPSLVDAESSFTLDDGALGALRSCVPHALSRHLRQDGPGFLEHCHHCAGELAGGEQDLASGYVASLAERTRAERLGFRPARLDGLLAAFHVADTSRSPGERRAAASLATGLLMTALASDRLPGSLTDELWGAWQRSGLRRDWLAAFLGPTILAEARGTGLQLAVHAIAGILTQPGVLEAFNDNPPSAALCRSAAAEAARWEPVNQVVPRTATRDVALGGAAIRRGDRILVVMPAVCRDPDAHHDPGTFLPGRKERSLAFGSGGRHCLGRELAVSRAAHAIQALWAHCAVRPSGPAGGTVTFGRYVTSLPVHVSPREESR